MESYLGINSIAKSLPTNFCHLSVIIQSNSNLVSSYDPWFILSLTLNPLFLSSTIQLHLPLTTPLPGSELTKEPFRWDQRLFALVLRIPGNASVEPEPLGGVPPDDSPITPMCEVTGGRRTENKLVLG